MDYQRLKIFCTVCRTGNFTRAARELGISQPAVSLSMKELEKSLGCTLFVRNENDYDKTVSPTPVAGAFLPFAQRVVKSHDDIDTVFHADTIGYDKVTIGATKSACELVLPQVLEVLRAIYPKIEFEVLGYGYGEPDTDVMIKTTVCHSGGRVVLDFQVKDKEHPFASVVETLLKIAK